jgi:(heptosyl)LPS beta-1,4-glucosyltransferase
MNDVIPISVCLIVKNEADRLEKTLQPIIGRFSEIIAYDSGSQDESISILKKLGVTVVSGSWLGFSRTRRAVWAMAKEQWILWLDADEIFTSQQIDEIGNLIKEKDLAGIKIRRRVVFEGKEIKHGDWGNDRVLRVFRKDNFEMADRDVHESVNVKGKVVKLTDIVEHRSFRDWKDLRARSQRYAELWAKQAFEAKKRAGIPFFNTVWKFVRGYILKSGWLDGSLGFKIALHNASEVYLKHSKLIELRRNHKS